MTLGFRTNLLAQSALSGLATSSRALGKIFERLSSGQRINGASDDPAGLAVETTLGAKIRISNRARQNVNDGISALNIADSALGSISGIITRLTELAETAANGSLSDKQRQTLSREYQALEQEIRRITGATNFNGINLLRGDKKLNHASETFSTTDLVGVESFSGDGRYLTYRAGTGAVQQYDRQAETTTVISASSGTRSPVSSADGSVVIYQSGNDLYKWTKSSGQSQKITNAQGAETYIGLSISADGGSVAFSALTQYQNGSLVSTASGTGTQRIFKIKLSSGVVSAVNSDTAGVFQSFQLSPDGSRLLFTSIANPLGLNADGNREVFVADYSGNNPTYSQITQTTTTNITLARIADNGQVFIATTLDLGGVNPGGFNNIIKYDINQGNFQKLTSNTSGNTITSLTTNTDGSLISFASAANLTGENTSGHIQVYQLDSVLGELRQATPETNAILYFSSITAISRDGTSLLYELTDGFIVPTSRNIGDLTGTSNQLVLDTGTGANGTISALLSDVYSTLRGLGGFAISAESGALGALDKLNSHLESISSVRGNIGAALSRLESANRLLGEQEGELTAARSRIVDIDTAEEAAALVRTQILQQSNIALLSSAKQQPQIALGLLNF